MPHGPYKCTLVEDDTTDDANLKQPSRHVKQKKIVSHTQRLSQERLVCESEDNPDSQPLLKMQTQLRRILCRHWRQRGSRQKAAEAYRLQPSHATWPDQS